MEGPERNGEDLLEEDGRGIAEGSPVDTGHLSAGRGRITTSQGKTRNKTRSFRH